MYISGLMFSLQMQLNTDQSKILFSSSQKSLYTYRNLSFPPPDLLPSPGDEQQVYQVRRGLSLAIMAWRCSKCSADQVCSPGCRQESDKKHLWKRGGEERRQGKSWQAYENNSKSQTPLCMVDALFHGTRGKRGNKLFDLCKNHRNWSIQEANMINIVHEVEIHMWLPKQTPQYLGIVWANSFQKTFSSFPFIVLPKQSIYLI